jgi:transcriptional regulator with XRE-family HTH domain
MKARALVASRLRRFRHERDLTQEELAAQTGLNRNYVGKIEREENSPTVDTLERLATVLKIPLKWFVVDDEEIPAGWSGMRTTADTRSH